MGAQARDEERVRPFTQLLFAQTMGLVAATAGLLALEAYLGRSLSNGVGFILFLVALGCLTAMRFAVPLIMLGLGAVGGVRLLGRRSTCSYSS